ncbi:MAG: hypothetical protein ACYC4Q_01265 [Victivallaceae bacterium]
MKKMVLFLMMCSGMLSSVLADGSLLEYVPNNADVIMGVRIIDSLNLPLVKEMRLNDKEFADKYFSFERELAKAGVTVKDMPPLAVVFSRQDRAYWGIVMDATIPEARFVELLKTKIKSNYNVDYSIEKINGQTVYCLENKVSKMGEPVVDPSMLGQKDMKKIGVFYLKSDVAMVTDFQESGKVLDEIKKGSCKTFIDNSGIDQNSVAWVIYHPSSPVGVSQQPLNSMGLALNFNGTEQKDIVLDAMVDCKNQNSAAMMTMQAQGMVMFGLSSAFKNNPALAADISNALKLKTDGNKVKANLQLPEKLHKQIKDYLIAHGPDSQAPAAGGEMDIVPVSKPVLLNSPVPSAKTDVNK